MRKKINESPFKFEFVKAQLDKDFLWSIHLKILDDITIIPTIVDFTVSVDTDSIDQDIKRAMEEKQEDMLESRTQKVERLEKMRMKLISESEEFSSGAVYIKEIKRKRGDTNIVFVVNSLSLIEDFYKLAHNVEYYWIKFQTSENKKMIDRESGEVVEW